MWRALGVPILLRELALLGGLVALLLVPVRPEHWQHVPKLLAGFVFYKLGGLAVGSYRPAWLSRVRFATRTLDYLFVFLLVWFTGGTQSQFWLLYPLLISLDSYEGAYRGGLASAALSSALYTADHLLNPDSRGWTHIAAHTGLFFIFGTALGWLSDRERAARAAAQEALRDLHLTQDRLVQSERLATVGQMTSKISHEVRNPLGAITLNLGLLEEVLPAGSEAARLLAATKDQVQALNTITEEYLQFGRLAQPRPEPMDPAGFLAGLLEAVEPELAAHGVRVVSEVTGTLPPMVVDPRLVRQALLNLIRNAAEAIGPGGTVRLGGRARDDQVEFWVADDGPGVAAVDLPRIFEPFYTTKPGGTGLGLAVVQQVALEHGGTVLCESQPGHGARFALWLPWRAPAPKREPAHA